MNKIFLIVSFLICSFLSFGQNGNWGQTNLAGNTSNISQTPGPIRGNGGTISASFVDTSAANAAFGGNKVNSVAGTQIYVTSTKSMWYWNGNRWIEISPQSAVCQPLLIGSATWSGVGLVYNVTALTVNFPTNNCVLVNTAAIDLTDAAADASYDRIDYILVNSSGVVFFRQGVAGSGIPPTINVLTERIVAQVNVDAGSLVPANGSIDIIYDENAAGEWAGFSNVAGIDYTATVPTPCYGTVSTKIPNPTNGQIAGWQDPNGASDISNGQYLKFRVKFSGVPTTGSTVLSIAWWNASTKITGDFALQNGSYGIDYSSTACQSVVVPITPPFNAPMTADRVIFTLSGAAGITMTLDRIYKLEGALPPPSGSGNSWNLDGNITTGLRAKLGTLTKEVLPIITDGIEKIVVPSDSIPITLDTSAFILTVASSGRPFLSKIRQPQLFTLFPAVTVPDSANKDWLRIDTASNNPNSLVNYAWANARIPAAGSWGLAGNSITSTDFIGATNAQPLAFKAYNTKSGLIGLTNTFFGKESGSYNTITGISNTGMGLRSLGNLTSGYNNTGLGVDALLRDSSGYQNVAIGHHSMLQNLTGHENVAVGAESMYNNTGSANVAVGFNSAQANSSGNYNTSLGYISLQDNLIGSRNIAIGARAAENLKGSANTIIGAYTNLFTTPNINNTVIIADGDGISTSRKVTFDSLGQAKFDQYTTGNFDGGTAADSVMVINSSGVIKKRNSSAFGGGGTPTLDQVTTAGNTTTNGIKVNTVQIQAGGGIGQIAATNVTVSETFELPDKGGAGGTFAMLSDVTAPSGNYGNLIFLRNGQSVTAGGDSLSFDATTLQLKIIGGIETGDGAGGTSSVSSRILSSNEVLVGDLTGNVYINVSGTGADETIYYKGTSNGHQFTGAIKAADGVEEFTASINLSGGDYTITKPGIYEVTNSSTNDIIWPDPDAFPGASITIINTAGTTAPYDNTNTFAPYETGTGTQRTGVATLDMQVYKSINGKWRGGSLL